MAMHDREGSRATEGEWRGDLLGLLGLLFVRRFALRGLAPISDAPRFYRVR